MLPIKKGKIRTKTQDGINNENTHVKTSIQFLQLIGAIIWVDIDDFDRSSVITVWSSVTNEVPNVVRTTGRESIIS